MRSVSKFVAILVAGCLAGLASGQLRVGAYNISNYAGGRVSALQTVLYGSFQGRSMAPDALVCVEFMSEQAAEAFLTILNTAPGSPADWARAPFVDGNDTESVFYFRTSKLDFLGMEVVAIGSSSSSNQPRNTYRYDVRPKGYDAEASVLAVYATHMKAGNTSGDGLRRLVEAQRIRDDAAQLPVGWKYLIAGDFNIPDASQSAYQALVNPGKGDGLFVDPIASPANWQSSAFRFLHTQDPAGAGGMDDRFDQILLAPELLDGDGFDYIGIPSASYSSSTWNDSNHSYRAWGNDGTSYDQTLRIAGNTMVGPTIAQALIDAAVGAGHIPVYLDLKVPPEVGSTVRVDFGIVPLGVEVSRTVQVWNAGDTTLWTALGIGRLRYTLAADGGFSVEHGSFTESAGPGVNSHSVTFEAASPGLRRGKITIASNAPDEPLREIEVVARVITFTGPGVPPGP